MKASKQRTIIAEVNGWMRYWQPHDNGEEGVGTWMWHKGNIDVPSPPDYLNDLNAMHEAVMHLRSKSPLNYVKYASQVTKIVAKFNSGLEDSFSISAHDATASQRAEAFLRAIGKWME